METLRLTLTDYIRTGQLSAADEAKLLKAAEILRRGGLAAFPTETVYGLGGNALLSDASEKIYAAKGRPSDNPLIAHIASMEALRPLVKSVPERAKKLAAAFWPGPLTMILEKSELVPYETTGGLDTVAVRMPEHTAARKLIELAGVPVAAPSANTSGRPSPTEASHVAEDLGGKIDAIVDGGAVRIGVESTIVDLSGAKPVLLRPGAVTRQMLEDVLSEEVLLDPALEKPLDPGVHPKAPGMKYRHYAPKAPMHIVAPADGVFSEKNLRAVEQAVCEEAKQALALGKRVGILCSEETLPYYKEKFQGNADCIGAAGAERAKTGHAEAEEAAAEAKVPAGQTETEVQQTPGAARTAACVLLMSAGSHQSDESFAHNLFGALREMDDAGVEFIAAEGIHAEALGYAVMNRMKKAAGQHIIYVS